MHPKSTVKHALVRAFVNRRPTPAIARLSLIGSAFVAVGGYWARFYLRPEQVFGHNSVGSRRWRLGWVGSHVILEIGLLGVYRDLMPYLLMWRFR
ncbi:hypothetical protein EVC37_19000 [Methylocaldum sp. BRCS4]|jgi:hypothetical protein|uniref:hypothetical protein n=1 Tax=Methylocaldum sp. 14B TaxID=1912213 RepID=UPI00098B2EB4|nr:hypothetical protein [Methylocaldum sp. 14B]MVF23681.1 hypothetical protein [Methylocaldum sp. BRCS4]